jgi:hypothetical protein
LAVGLVLSALVSYFGLGRYGTAHSVLVRNESGETMTKVRVGILFGGAEVELLPIGAEVKVEFYDGGEGSYAITSVKGDKALLIGRCGYSGGLPGRAEKLTIVIEKSGLSCEPPG